MSLPVKLFSFTYRSTERLTQLLHAVNRSIFLGLLTQKDFQELTDLEYQRNPMYLNRDYNLSGLFHWEKPIIEQYFAGCRNILVTSAGGGRELIALARSGFDVHGFECSSSLLQLAKELIVAENIRAAITSSQPGEVPSELGQFDGIVVGWGSYSHICSGNSRIRFLKELQEHLKPEGPVLISFNARQRSSSMKSYIPFSRLIARFTGNNFRPEPGDFVSASGFHHYFTWDEIEQEIRSAGLEIILRNKAESSYVVARRSQ